MENTTTSSIQLSGTINDFNDYTTTLFPIFDNLVNPDKRININDTVDLTRPSTKAFFSIYDYVIPTIGALIIVTNLAVVISSGLILKKGQQPRSTYLFLGNVAMTDLITGIAVVFGQLYPKQNRDEYVCSIQIGMIVSSTLASVYSVGLIAVDRFLYILHGIKYATWVYPNRARLLIGLTWIIGCLIGYLPLLGWRGDTGNGKICWFILLAPKELILLTVILGMIPILVVIILYTTILYKAIKTINQIKLSDAGISRNQAGADGEENSVKNLRMFRGKRNADASNKAMPNSPSKWKAIKVVLFTTSSFLLTWSPYFITSVLYVYKCEFNSSESGKCKKMRILIASPLAILGFLNSFFNPIIYAWWHQGFRRFTLNNIISKCGRSKQVVVTGSCSHSRSKETSGNQNMSLNSESASSGV